MTGSDFFTSADPLLSANNSLFAITTVLNNGPPSPPWDEGDLDTAGGGLDGKDNVELDSLDFLSLSPESLRLDSETEEVITNFLTSVDDLDDLSTSSSEGIVASASLNFSDLVYGSLSNNSATSAVVAASNIEPLEAVYLSDSSRGSSSSSNDKNNNADVLLSVNKQLTTSTNINNTTSSSSSSVFSESIGYCSVCTLVFASASLLEDHKQEFEDRVICCHCKKSFNTMSKLRTHHRKHSKEKPFKCQICDKYYTHRNTLARHQLFSCRPLKIKTEEPNPSETAADDPLTRMILEAEVVLDQKTTATPTNNGKRKSSILQQNSTSAIPTKVSKITSDTLCLVCDKEFHDASSLENHRNYHLNHRECCRCHKVLGNKSKLLTHHRSHTKELPYHCSLCAKSFAELSTLRKHEATHGERNFRCDICSKAFVRKDYLAKHSLTHRQTFKCSQCSYVCHIKVDIERHVTSMHSS